MSPDIEWHIGEDAEQETIARTSSPRRSRRGQWAVMIAIGLGVGLALLYRSIPEPPPKPIDPTPAPAVFQSPPSRPLSPLPTPQTLEAAIERDALRLAALSDTDGVTFDPALSQMPQAYADWYAALQNAYGSWGPITPRTPFTIFETGTLPSGVAWVKLGQFRNGDFFRHMRFYQWRDDRWVWTLPELGFWTGSQAEVATGDASPIGPVSVLHPIVDAPVVGAVFDRFTRAYLNLCESLRCPRAPSSTPLWTPGLTLTLTISPLQTEATVQERGNATLHIALPSPRVVGYYEDPNGLGDPFTAMAYDTLIAPIVRLASGDYARWKTDRGGELFLQAITTWKRARIQEALHPLELFYPPALLSPASIRGADGELISLQPNYVRLLQNEQQLPLDSVWNWDSNGTAFGLLQHIAVNEARVVIIFIEDRFGADGVVRFLNALGHAGSLEEALEAGLSIEYGEFLKEWSQWSSGE
jgi:hypothetical protein